MMSEYLLECPQIDRLVVVGTGGTGSFLAEGLCRLLMGNEQIELGLVDPDPVEERNLLRQNFTADEVGLPKSEALARRLSPRYNRAISYAAGFFEEGRELLGHRHRNVLIGCVDNAAARRALDRAASGWNVRWLIDCGNGDDYGQALIGNCRVSPERAPPHLPAFRPGVCLLLPTPGQQQPELLRDAPLDEERPDLNCTEALLLQEQSPAINQAMAALALHLVRELLLGRCSLMGMYLDLRRGTMFATRAMPEEAGRIWNMKPEALLE